MDESLGPLVVSAEPALLPPRTPLHGRYSAVVPLQPEHWRAIYRHLGGEENAWRWKYMLIDGFSSEEACETTIKAWSASQDPVYYAVLSGPASDAASEPAGMLAYLGIVPGHRRIEIGGVILGEVLKHSRAATEAFYLFMKHSFEDLGYLRVEWKANQLNEPSVAAAKRLGFTFEGIFRKHMIVKGRRRDTAWLSIIDDEWEAARRGFELWLDESNFDENGKQKRGLRECRET
ncbi:acyl-CoA N-acyltransferase [Trichoderma citrinoviride]|uniref:Acyl-CoA N-acyltransferase n=1 Tax=Trichoderma citrinoviride TaxID=58853 RepID=A0A2T4B055_9HYPO|nr:acyl-CoA N-acyltransferase [Trichoderma citrinoviride]PTB62611.1 acyl-CoA N-acyltransferase [Trichoderma citrinoviride]